MKARSPYLEDFRLADVIVAVQTMGEAAHGSHKTEWWATKLGAPRGKESWSAIFENHPEFFHVSDEAYASLRWRHGREKTYDAEKKRHLRPDEMSELTDSKRKLITQEALSSEEIAVLIKTAISFHSRMIAHRQEKRWLTPSIVGLFGIVLGAFLNTLTRGS